MRKFFLLVVTCGLQPLSAAAPGVPSPRAPYPPPGQATPPMRPRPDAGRMMPPAGSHDHGDDEAAHHTGEEDDHLSRMQAEDNLDYFWRKSDDAFHKGDYERAVRIHRAIVSLQSDEVESYGVAAWLLWSLGHKEKALEFIQQGLRANPNNHGMWHEAAEHHSLQKQHAEAQRAYSRSLELAPAGEDQQMTRRRLAHAAEKAGDLKKSLEVWEGLARDYPQEPVNKNNLARVKKQMEDKDKTPAQPPRNNIQASRAR